MNKVQSSGKRSSSGTNTKSRKENETKIDDRGYFGSCRKKEASKKIIEENMKPKEIGKKNMMKPIRCGSITSAETSNYTTKVLSRQCTKTEEISSKKTCSSTNVLSQKTVTSF